MLVKEANGIKYMQSAYKFSVRPNYIRFGALIRCIMGMDKQAQSYQTSLQTLL